MGRNVEGRKKDHLIRKTKSEHMSKAEGGRSHQQTDVQSLPGKQSLNMLNGYLNGKANAITINAPTCLLLSLSFYCQVQSHMVCNIPLLSSGQICLICSLQVLPTSSLLTFGKEESLVYWCYQHHFSHKFNAQHLQADRRKVNFLASSWQELVQFLVKAAHLLHETRGQEDRRVNSFTGEVIKNRTR